MNPLMLTVTPFVALGVFFMIKYSETILEVILNGLNCSKITKTQDTNMESVYTVKTDYGKLYLNTVKIPSDIDIFLFNNSVISEDQLMSRKDFNILYSENKCEHLTKYRDKLITSFNTTYDINGTATINGYIDSYFENCVYVFKINEKIDFNSLINTYRCLADDKDDDDSEQSTGVLSGSE